MTTPEIRRAINYAIDRDQLVAIGWQGAGTKSHLPLPDFPPIRQYTDTIQDLVEKYEIGVHDPAKAAADYGAQGGGVRTPRASGPKRASGSRSSSTFSIFLRIWHRSWSPSWSGRVSTPTFA